MGKKIFLLGVILIFSYFPVNMLCCYSGLLVVPTTDLSGDGNFIIDLQWEGWGNDLTEKQSILNTQLGIGEKFELGLDFNLTDTSVDDTVLFNVKYLLPDLKVKNFKIAVGFYNGNKELDFIPYLIATKEFSYLRVHAGIQREYDGNINYILGIERKTENGWQLMIDRISGDENYLSLGVGYSGGSLGFMVGCQQPNGGGKPEIVFHLFWTIPIKK